MWQPAMAAPSGYVSRLGTSGAIPSSTRSLGQWAENKRCPACGERRFALKTQAEMNIAIASLGITGLFILALYALVKLA